MDQLVKSQLDEIERLMEKSKRTSNPIKLIKQILKLEASIMLQINEPKITSKQQKALDKELSKL